MFRLYIRFAIKNNIKFKKQLMYSYMINNMVDFYLKFVIFGVQ